MSNTTPPELDADVRALANTLSQDTARDVAAQCTELAQQHGWLPEIERLTGLAELVSGNPAQAAEHLGRAANAMPQRPDILCNLGEAHRRNHAASAALDALQRALRLKPDYLNARYNLGCTYFDLKAYEAAEEAFSLCLELAPDQPRYHAARADALRGAGRHSAALNSYQLALSLDPDFADAMGNMAPLLAARGDFLEAEKAARRSIELSPGHWQPHLNLGRTLARVERLDEAMDCFANAYEISPAEVDISVAIARVWRSAEDYPQSAFWYNKVLEVAPDHLEARVQLAALAFKSGLREDALVELHKLAGENEQEYLPLKELAEALWEQSQGAPALEAVDRALTLQPEQPSLHCLRAQILASSGDMRGAEDGYRKALELNAYFPTALHGLAMQMKGNLDAEHLDRIEQLLQSAQIFEGARATLTSARAFYLDGRKNYEEAFKAATAANELQWTHRQRRGWEYDPAAYEQEISQRISLFNAAFFADRAGWGLAGFRPVFVVGMPRSGTTLTEQIIGNHPNALGLGERDFASRSLTAAVNQTGPGNISLTQAIAQISADQVAEIASSYRDVLLQTREQLGKPEATVLVDKMPENYALLGWLYLLFPGARFVHCQRDTRDTALSCWFTQFGKIRWASNIEHIVPRFEQYQRIMTHWRDALPTPIFERRYEDGVTAPESAARELLQFLDLAWDPACLDTPGSDSVVRTASISQVRKPIYRDSVGRWKRYSPWLDAMFDQLTP